MDLKLWRQTHQKTLFDCAEALGLANARTYQRYETGENRADADIAERICQMTKGAVTIVDLHRMRLQWLKEHRPEKFSIVIGAEYD